MVVSKQFFLSRTKMIGFLDELEKSNTDRSLYVPPGLSLTDIEKLFKNVPDLQAIPHELAELAISSKIGAVFFLSPSKRYVILPPFPIAETTPGYAVESLRSLLKSDFRIALVLVRLGAYAIGLCQGENLINSKVGTGLVHGRHRQGGSSAARFRRHREKQIEYFLGRVCQHAREQLEPQAPAVDYIVFGGAGLRFSCCKSAAPSCISLTIVSCRRCSIFLSHARQYWKRR